MNQNSNFYIKIDRKNQENEELFFYFILLVVPCTLKCKHIYLYKLNFEKTYLICLLLKRLFFLNPYIIINIY